MKKTMIISICIALVVLLSSCSSIVKNVTELGVTQIPDYLTDYDAQYNETDEELQITFGFKNSNKKYITTSGTAKVVIKDKTGNKLFSDTISFDKNDFSDYTSKLWNGSRNLCGIFIPSKIIKPSASDEGTIKLTISALDNKVKFDSQNIDIFGLPTKSVEIKKPKLPVKVSYYNFDKKETVLSITDISVKSEIVLDEASAEISLTVKMISNNLEDDNDSYEIKCVLKNSKNIIVDSNEIYGDYLDNGESEKIDLDFYELDPNQSYTLSFKNVDNSFDY